MAQEWGQGRNQKVSWNKWKWTNNSPKPMGHSEGRNEREVQSHTGLPKKDRNISNKQHYPTSIRTRGTTTREPRGRRGSK